MTKELSVYMTKETCIHDKKNLLMILAAYVFLSRILSLSHAHAHTHAGDWQYGKKHGRGRYVRSDGTVYQGEYNSDRKVQFRLVRLVGVGRSR